MLILYFVVFDFIWCWTILCVDWWWWWCYCVSFHIIIIIIESVRKCLISCRLAFGSLSIWRQENWFLWCKMIFWLYFLSSLLLYLALLLLKSLPQTVNRLYSILMRRWSTYMRWPVSTPKHIDSQLLHPGW